MTAAVRPVLTVAVFFYRKNAVKNGVRKHLVSVKTSSVRLPRLP